MLILCPYDLIDHLTLQPSRADFLDSLICLFGPDEVITAISYGNVILTDNVVYLNIQ